MPWPKRKKLELWCINAIRDICLGWCVKHKVCGFESFTAQR